MAHDDLTHPVAQQQLLRLSSVPKMRRNLTSGPASSRLSLQRQGSDPKNSNTPMLSSLPKQVLRDILDTLEVCKVLDEHFDWLKDALLG